MAYLFRSEQILAFRLDQLGFYSTDQSCLVPVTVAFVDNNGNRVRQICPRQNYFLLMDTGQYIGNNLVPTDGYQNAAPFRPLVAQNGQMSFNNPFLARFGTDSPVNYYTLEPSQKFASVGYLSPLPITLSQCQNCGCLPGFFCSPNGRCIKGRQPCSPNSICSGRCPGRCPEGSNCVQSGNGLFFCSSEINNAWFWTWIVILVVLVGGLFVVLLIILLNSPSSTKSNLDEL